MPDQRLPGGAPVGRRIRIRSRAKVPPPRPKPEIKPVQHAAATVGAVFGLLGLVGFLPGLTVHMDDLTVAGEHTTKNWSGVLVPTLILGGEADTVAPVAQHSEPFYTSMSAVPEKAYLELNNASHGFPTTPNVPQSRMMISWLKAFVDNDTRYLQFLCPGPSPDPTTEEYRNTCPLAV